MQIEFIRSSIIILTNAADVEANGHCDPVRKAQVANYMTNDLSNEQLGSFINIHVDPSYSLC